MEMKKVLSLHKIVHEDVQSAVNRVFQDLDAASLFHEGMVVLLKPNLLGPFPVERAATTHPEVVRSVIRYVKQFHPKQIIVGDSSGGKSPDHTLKALKTSGILRVCEEEGVKALPLEKTERYIYPVPHPLVLKEIASTVLLKDVDIIINLPKIKTHELTYLTCAIKNMFGTVLLVNKAQIHAKFPSMFDFNAALADVYSVSQPQVTIVDGYYAQEGKGPSAGDVVKFNTIVGGFDGVAIDTLVSRLIGLDPQKVIYLEKCVEKGVGSMDLTQYTILGDPIEDIFRQFKIKKRFWINLPIPKAWMKKLADRVFQPTIRIDPKKCKICSTCWENCPVDALSPPENRKIGVDVPKWDSKKCIACYCCAELCPHKAIEFNVKFVRNIVTSPFFLIAAFCVLGIIGGLIYWL